MCLYPRLIKNRKYQRNKKNGGNVPKAQDSRVRAVPIGCGSCVECRKKKSRDWQVRLHEELREGKWAEFVTLTFSEEALVTLGKEIKGYTGYERENKTAKLAVKRFLERWRKKHKKSIKHWLITELGHKGTERIHLHGILWNEKYRNRKQGTRSNTEKEIIRKDIEKYWKYGRVGIGDYVNDQTIGYIVKYITKLDRDHKEYKGIVLTSPGIGNNYTKRADSKNNKYKGKKTIETYKTRSGKKIALPIYYRNKIYNEEEREKLWLDKLDQEERWVTGTKIDISKGIEGYIKVRNEARLKNKRLGYGDNKKDRDREQYENNLRELLRLTREQKIWKMNQKKK